MTTTPRSAPDTPAMTSYEDIVAFLRAHGAHDLPARYRINAAGLFNVATATLHLCDTGPLYHALGAPYGAELTIGATQIEVKYEIMLHRNSG